jgi:valyl-tRNA synthetase
VKLRLDFNEGANKVATRDSLTTLLTTFESSLRLLSPFMPFLTEELWHALYEDGKLPAKSIALTSYPHAGYQDPTPRRDMLFLKGFITDIRSHRKDLGVEEKLAVDVSVTSSQLDSLITNNLSIICRLAKVNDLQIVNRLEGPNVRTAGLLDFQIIYEKQIDVPAERERLTKDIARYEKGLASAERQLGNEGFLAKAPAHVVEGLKKQEAETRLLLEKARRDLDALPE